MSSLPPPPPSPAHTLRLHSSPVNTLYITDNNERIYSGDFSGTVVATSTRTLRPIAKWNAHKDGILGVEEWDDVIITHGRDNKLHVWERVEEAPASMRIGSGTAALVDLSTPKLRYSMDVNALNFCRFSLLRLPLTTSLSVHQFGKALIALPNLIDSSTADIWTLHDRDRIHAAVGQELNKADIQPGVDTKKRDTYGIIMSLHLYLSSSASDSASLLRLLCAYENGSVVLWRYTRKDSFKSVEGQGWEMIWSSKLHTDSIMAMRVSRNNEFALTVSANHIIGRYDLNSDDLADVGKINRTKHPGNGCIAIRDDGRVCAIGGWDGRVRLYSTKSFKTLGTLRYHKTACQAVEFCHSRPPYEADHDSDDEDEGDKEKRSRWLVCGAKDHRATIWELMNFEKVKSVNDASDK